MPSGLPAFSLRVTLAKPPQGPGETAARVTRPNETMRNAITLGLQMLTLQAQRERFTGKGPFPVPERKLGVVTGRLRRDLHSEPAEVTGDGYRGRVGSVVEYFRGHELGFDGQVSVRAHVRAAREVNRKARKRTTKSGKEITIRANQFSLMPQSVRAHTRQMKVPERRPLRTAVEDHSVRILGQAVQRAIAQILNSPT